MENSEFLFNIIRESVSLFILLVFVFLTYRLVDKFGGTLQSFFDDLLAVLEKIADNQKPIR